MRKLMLSVIGIAMTSLGFGQTVSPELVSSSGDSFSSASYQLDWSIGECVTATHSAGSYVIAQGFHTNTFVISTVKDLRADVEISVYPNPTSDFITLNFAKVQNFGKVSYTLTDFSGKVLQTTELKSETQQINFTNRAGGTYFITISLDNQLVKSFQIIKK